MEALRSLLQTQALSPLAWHFSQFIARRVEANAELLSLSAALVAERNLAGDVCVELRRFAGAPLFGGGTLRGPALDAWLRGLGSSPLVGGPGATAPLILDGGKLYLGRLWHAEQELADAILRRLALPPDPLTEGFRRDLDRLFPPGPDGEGQKFAAALAASRRFAVIAGGPGTGKTATVVRVLALLRAQNPRLLIRLAAPTGKAAARMLDSIRRQSHLLPDDLGRGLPNEATTIHRLLGFGAGGWRFNRAHRLRADCVVIDEASMVDLTLAHRLVAALEDEARIILLGDRDQLAAVEAGNVLGDITGRGQEIRYSPDLVRTFAGQLGFGAELLPEAAAPLPLCDCIGLLRRSFRFDPAGGIGRLAALVNDGSAAAVLAFLRAAGGGEVRWRDTTPVAAAKADVEAAAVGAADVEAADVGAAAVGEAALNWALDRYRQLRRSATLDEALAGIDKARLLCVQHAGPSGRVELNRRLRSALAPGDEDVTFAGELLMVSVNDPETGLYNGDTGLVWPGEDGALRLWFPRPGEAPRGFPIASLPPCEPAFAMTVHKAQGSEFDEVLLLLPEDPESPLLTRELLYTAITRARRSMLIQGSPAALTAACRRRVSRSSGLASRLGWPEDPAVDA